eukprot:311165-Pleurochrysis_carterae.AAC.1
MNAQRAGTRARAHAHTHGGADTDTAAPARAYESTFNRKCMHDHAHRTHALKHTHAYASEQNR